MNDNNQIIQKFNGTASTFSVFGKLIEKSIAEGLKDESGLVVSNIADLLIKEIIELKEMLKPIVN